MLIAVDSDQILGFTGFGTEASELMAAVQVAMITRCPTPPCAPRSLPTPPPPKD
jgi:pyruvate/2-oxoglutarate dehydrogenase complex dihydrolipoamide dehydrogenase (E3) component